MPRDDVDSNKKQDQQQDPDAQPVDDTMQQTTNATMENPQPADPRTNNDQGSEQTESPIQSP
jgi:hypothetical protein